MSQYTVTLKGPRMDEGDESLLSAVRVVDDNLAWAFGYVISGGSAAGMIPRKCNLVCGIVSAVLEDASSDHEPWPGYGEAVDALVSAAEKIRIGWQEHDVSLGLTIRGDGMA